MDNQNVSETEEMLCEDSSYPHAVKRSSSEEEAMNKHSGDTVLVAKRVRTERLEIVNPEGEVRMILATLPGDTTVLSLRDNRGRDRAQIHFRSDKQTAGVVLMDRDGNSRLQLAVDDKGVAMLTLLFEGTGEMHLMVGMKADGDGTIAIFDKERRPLWAAP